MPNNVINKVVYGDRTLIDLTDTTATAETILSGYGAYGADGVWVDGTATAGSLSGHVWQDNEGYIHLDDDGGDMYITTPLNVTTNGTYTAPTGVAYTPVSVTVPTGIDAPIFTVTLDSMGATVISASCNKTYSECIAYVSDNTSAAEVDVLYQGVSDPPIIYGATSGNFTASGLEYCVTPGDVTWMKVTIAQDNSVTVVFNPVAYRTSSDLTANGATITAPSGYYSSSASKSVASGTAGTPTATKGTVSNHSVSVTPSVTNTTGYITGSTKTGTAVTVTASELASGNKAITQNGDNIDVVGYSTVSVAVPGATYTATLTGTPSETSAFVRYNNTYYYTVGDEITFSAGDTMTLSAMGVRYGGDVSIDGTVVASDPDNGVNYNYTLPNHDIIIDCASGSTAHLSVTFPTISITSNGNKQDVHEYYYADVNVSGGATYTATISGTGASSTCRAIYNNTFYYTDGATFTYSAGDTITLSCIGQRMNAYVYIDGTLVKTGSDTWANYEYTAPDHDIEIQLTYSSDSYIRVVFPTISITANGNKQDVHDYYYADVNVSGGGGAEEKQVNFIDYDGTLVASKTKAEINAMTSDSDLPANPSHTGLTAQGWNWTVAQLKAQLLAQPDDIIWVGQMYVTTSGDTEIDVSFVDSARLSPTLTIAVNGTITVDWGDNTTANTVTGTSLTTRKTVSHTYASTGNYTMVIHITSGTFTFYCSSTYLLLRKSTISSENRVYANCVRAVRFGSGVTNINNYAFYCCYSLSSVTIPSGVTSIGNYAFGLCRSLSSVTIPSNVASIVDNTFSGCLCLSSITIPSNVTSIGISAFTDCSTLSSITMPSGVTSVGKSAFNGCYNLSSITIPSGVTSIGEYAFGSCYSLSSVTILSGVTSIGDYAFSSCYTLSSITLPSGVTSIGEYAFNNCSRLFSITIPSGVTSIGIYAFYGCYLLSSITIPSNITSIGNYVFGGLVSLPSITIPSNVTSIGISAFNGCSCLSSITIPSGVTSIGNSAFYNCTGMAEYHVLPTTPPTLGTSVFASIPSDCKIYVPYSSDHSVLTAYQTDWGNYISTSFIVEESE